jgi:hypothetical protein
MWVQAGRDLGQLGFPVCKASSHSHLAYPTLTSSHRHPPQGLGLRPNPPPEKLLCLTHGPLTQSFPAIQLSGVSGPQHLERQDSPHLNQTIKQKYTCLPAFECSLVWVSMLICGHDKWVHGYAILFVCICVVKL